MTDPATIKAFIEQLNSAWREGRYDDLAAFYHADVVLLPPDAGEAIRGRDAVVRSYADFGAAAELEGFDVLDIEVFPFEHQCMVHMKFAVTYRYDGRRFEDQGMELYSVQTAGAAPAIIWRCQWLQNSRSEALTPAD